MYTHLRQTAENGAHPGPYQHKSLPSIQGGQVERFENGVEPEKNFVILRFM